MTKQRHLLDAPLQQPDRVGDEKNRSEWDCVTEASWESFPASDPPAWIHRRDSREREHGEPASR